MKTRYYSKYALRVLLVTLCDLALRVVIKIQYMTTLHSLKAFEKAFDSVWVDGLLFKLLEHNISCKMYQIIKSFLKTRVASIELNGYQSPKFQIVIGVPQGSVLSPLLFIIFLNDFLSNQAQKFKFADDSSLMATGKDPSELSAFLRKTCSDIEKWCGLEDVSERRKN